MGYVKSHFLSGAKNDTEKKVRSFSVLLRTCLSVSSLDLIFNVVYSYRKCLKCLVLFVTIDIEFEESAFL
jgi:hypothetical protein